MAALAEFFYPLGVNKLEMFRDGELQHPNEWQHFTMYSYFAISGIVDIISLKILEHRSKTLEKLFVALAFGVESFLLYNHRHGKGSLENNIHILIFITAFACCVVSAAEIWHPTQWLLPFMRTGLVSLQGTFFFHAAFIIYRPVSGIPWDSNDHRATMFVTMAYSWHILLNIIIMSCIYGTVYLFCGRRWRKRSQYYVNESPSKSNGIRQEEIEMIADTSDDEQYSSLRPLKN
ncbi:transmembrane protein 45B-like [Saccoglossus kowalevskii]